MAIQTRYWKAIPASLERIEFQNEESTVKQ